MTRWLIAVGLLLPALGRAQQIDLNGEATPVRGRQYVVYAAEPMVVAAGKPGALELRFQVRDGFHVNSHRPKSELLLATQLELAEATGVRLGAPEFTVGKPYVVAGEALDVYTDSFSVRVPVTAVAGSHELTGTLRYQACDRAACYPPKLLPVRVLFESK